MQKILDALPQDQPDTQPIMSWINQYGSLLLDRMPQAHLTASGFIFNASRTKTLMIYHNIYQTYALPGGHADGDHDLLCVALREAREETGAGHIHAIDGTVCAVDILPLKAHIKRGQPVDAHLHLNLTYALQCNEDEALHIKPDENSDVAWLNLSDLPQLLAPHERQLMLPIYEKIIRKYCN